MATIGTITAQGDGDTGSTEARARRAPGFALQGDRLAILV